jgi:hypothetical protein
MRYCAHGKPPTSPEAARFYRYCGFQPSPGNETTLMMTLAGLEQALR